ncbi:aspartic proteinase nepenthesin-2-like [Ziziphus jujuba]|uniref:Aspartic proteinase nepenthesin-2-like n=1 Tax=Ziziphus jujuba TaxID=326968 RepID=A0A6P4ALA8_ZIZJJ|nr:aspartic proteinase nepenthesin-2-like [Ziziphus jujuba]
MVLLRICIASVFLLLLSLSLVSYNTSKPTGFSLKLIPSDSPDSPFYPGKLTQHERIQRMVELSKARAKYVGLLSTANQISTFYPENIYLKMYIHSLFYSVQVFIGTPKRPQTLLMDTGSHLIWTQCRPCINCFNQTDPPIFIPNTSATYRKLPCAHPICRQLYQCVKNECVYNQRYGGGSVTKGLASVETFAFPFNSNQTRSVGNIVFGCSNDNQNFTFSGTGRISGILGLGPYPDSLPSQLRNLINKRFSYCLPSSMTQNSVLRFGEDIQIIPNLKRTPFVRMNRSSHYFLNLLDISVAGHRLGFPPGAFSLKQNGSGGVVIDSGCTVTNMEREPYGVVMREFQNHFVRFGLERVVNSSEGFELCYKQRRGFSHYAGLTFHFEGADMVVQPQFMYVQNYRMRYFCVALLPFTGPTLIGAWQQQNTRFIYDLNLQELQFAPEDCSRDRLFS